MNNTVGVLIAVAIGLVLVATVLFLVIPEPAGRAVIATESLDVAVLDFGNSASWPGVEETLARRIEASLVRADAVSVYSRAQLDALLLEHALSDTGFIDPTTAVEIGSLSGVNKLIVGSVYAVDTSAEETTLCVTWQDGDCIETTPATKYAVRVRAQVQVIDARTGMIEHALDLFGSDQATVRSNTAFGGFDSLLANASVEMASDVVDALSTTYTRELRYGLYREIEVKNNGYIGRDEASRFSARRDDAHFIVHFTRIQDYDLFDVVWAAEDGTVVEQFEDVVSDGEWRHYELDLSGLAPGRYHVHGLLNGSLALDAPFSVVP